MEKRTGSKTQTISVHKPQPHSSGLQQLNVMCVYQDDPTHEAAGQAGRAAINGTPVARRSWWNLEDFSEPGVLAGAAYMGMRADIIVVALSCKEGLPLPFYVWANSWLPYRKIPGGALVAVLDDQDENKWVAEHAREFLRALAAQANMKFVVERPNLSTETGTQQRFTAHKNRQHSLQHANGRHSALVC